MAAMESEGDSQGHSETKQNTDVVTVSPLSSGSFSPIPSAVGEFLVLSSILFVLESSSNWLCFTGQAGLGWQSVTPVFGGASVFVWSPVELVYLPRIQLNWQKGGPTAKSLIFQTKLPRWKPQQVSRTVGGAHSLPVARTR